jgi:hypothetical protein
MLTIIPAFYQAWWLTLIILATWEVEIRRITVQSQLWQIVFKTLYREIPSQKQDW